MSDVMLEGVIRMPYRLAMEDEFSRIQFYQRAQEALTELESLRAEVASLKEENARLTDEIDAAIDAAMLSEKGE